MSETPLRRAFLVNLILASTLSVCGCGKLLGEAMAPPIKEAIANGKPLFLYEQRYCILWEEDKQTKTVPDGTVADSMPFPTLENWMELSKPLAELRDELEERCDRAHCFFAIFSLQEMDEAAISEVTRTLDQCGHIAGRCTPALPARWSMNE